MEHLVTLDSDVELPPSVTTASLSSLVRHVLVSEGVDDMWQVGVRFVNDATMQEAHAEFMDIDEPTDIMTFPYGDDDEVWGESEPGGDLLISADTARENATAVGWSLPEELFFLVAHGLLHLLGRDDHDEADRAAMLDRQRVLIESWAERP